MKSKDEGKRDNPLRRGNPRRAGTKHPATCPVIACPAGPPSLLKRARCSRFFSLDFDFDLDLSPALFSKEGAQLGWAGVLSRSRRSDSAAGSPFSSYSLILSQGGQQMPNPMVHLSVAKNMLGLGFTPKDLSLFYLGAISPDAIHMRKDSDRAAKDKSHLLSGGKSRKEIEESEYFALLEEFVASNKHKTNMDFLLGYCAHILTDMYWAAQVYVKFNDAYQRDTAPLQEKKWAYYNDTDILDQTLFNECGWRAEIWRELQSADCFDFLDILSKDEINAWNERTLHWYDSGESQHKNPVRYITKTDAYGFIESCPSSIMQCKIFA
jgi:hypothetical protein